MGITSGNGDLRRKRERLHALSLLDDLFPVAVVKSLAVYGIFTLLVNTLCDDRTQEGLPVSDSSACLKTDPQKPLVTPLKTGSQHFV